MTVRALVALVATAVLTSCALGEQAQQTVDATSTVRVAITEATYGSLRVITMSGARCSADVRVTRGELGDPPETNLAEQAADPAGTVRWTYSAPRVPKSSGGYHVVCRSGAVSGSADASFDTGRPPIVATGLTVRITTDVPQKPEFQPDPALVSLRDDIAARLESTLGDEWSKATRGLGQLRVTDTGQDITVYVVAATGTSVYRQSRDGSGDIQIFAADHLERTTPENGVATALHEVGHIWCCHGPDADQSGHWLVKERDPGLYGVDRFGLMTDPVTCVKFGTVLSCPNRFSDREMRALGFTSFPPPSADPCVAQAIALDGQIAASRAQLDALGAAINDEKATLSSLDRRIRSLEASYPRGMPPSVYAEYQSLVAQYNALVAQVNADVDRYGALQARGNELIATRNGLPCDAS